MIGLTPLLEFKIEAPKDTPQEVTVDEDGKVNLDLVQQFISTELTGRFLKKAVLEFDQTTREPRVSLQFDETGTKLLLKLQKKILEKWWLYI